MAQCYVRLSRPYTSWQFKRRRNGTLGRSPCTSLLCCSFLSFFFLSLSYSSFVGLSGGDLQRPLDGFDFGAAEEGPSVSDKEIKLRGGTWKETKSG